VAGSLAAIGIAYLAVTAGSARSPFAPLAVALFMALPAYMFFSRQVAVSLAILLLYLGLADGLVKLETNSQFATLGRDVLLYAIAVGILFRHVAHGRRDVPWPVFTGWIVAWTALSLVEILNPEGGSMAHCLAAVRQHLEFIPLFFIGASVIDSTKRLRTLVTLLLFVAAVNGGVALYQSALTPDQLAGWGPGYADLIHGVRGAPRTAVGEDGKPRVRPPGLGGDMGFAGVLGATALPGGLALLIAGRRRRGSQLFIASLVVFAALGPMASQSRGAVLETIFTLAAFAGLVAASKRAKQLIVGLLIVGVLVTAAVGVVSKSAGTSSTFYRYRSITPDKVVGTTVDSRSGTLGLLVPYAKQYPFGAGLGSTGPATSLFGGPRHELSGESQFTFLVVELGIPGLLLFLGMQGRVLILCAQRIRRYADQEAQILLAGLLAPLIGYIPVWIVGITTTSTPNAPFMWLTMGIFATWLFGRRGEHAGESSVPAR
jgi:hypothetical protein